MCRLCCSQKYPECIHQSPRTLAVCREVLGFWGIGVGRSIFSAYPFHSPCILIHENVLFVQKLNLGIIKLKWNQMLK